MKFVVSTNLVVEKGVVYVLEIDLDDGKYVKIGMTSRKVEERVVEILTEMWKRYRYFPRCYVARFRVVEKPMELEKKLHEMFKEYSVEMAHRFGGSGEFFQVDVEKVKEIYDELVQSR